jgi:hypothetical protein
MGSKFCFSRLTTVGIPHSRPRFQLTWKASTCRNWISGNNFHENNQPRRCNSTISNGSPSNLLEAFANGPSQPKIITAKLLGIEELGNTSKHKLVEFSFENGSATQKKAVYQQRIGFQDRSTALDFINNLRQEYPSMNIGVTHTITSTKPALSDVELDTIPIHRMLNTSLVFWFNQNPYIIDNSHVLNSVRIIQEYLSLYQQKSDQAKSILQALDRKVRNYMRLVTVGGGLVLNVELAVIVYLTYELGWVRILHHRIC